MRNYFDGTDKNIHKNDKYKSTVEKYNSILGTISFRVLRNRK